MFLKDAPLKSLAVGSYYRLNVYVPTKFLCWNPKPSVAVFADGAAKEVIKVK